ncbi:acid phosphatase AphA [Xenorhabdus bovienii]|uniref:acid phosphatase AphA n=1 Tax=Xenorhabdus bovienii TaxID=40576 RepID=UPI0023B33BCF|nr:acid phosphatase AphA [Xenorhabdus bovienii]MDE9541072.1 acid phosphatase AphA [Xenorhabdus bovienii]
MKNKFLLLSAIAVNCALFTVSFANAETSQGYTTSEILDNGFPSTLLTITVLQLQHKLKSSPPISVGFDIDDTVLFSSPAFYYADREFSSKNHTKIYNQAYWDKINCGLDAFSIPKNIARKLIDMHQSRGDTIYFITGRTGSKCDFLDKYLQQTFAITHFNKVIFVGSSKTHYMKSDIIAQKNIKIFYGDSDIDIISARLAYAEGIRILRSANSTYKPFPKIGKYGESVLRDSDH